MKRLLFASLALALLSGCATVGPRPGETPCAYGLRLMDEAQHRIDQARAAAETACVIGDLQP